MSHNYQSSFASKWNLQIPSVQTTSYGKNAFVYMVIKSWVIKLAIKILSEYERNEKCDVEHIFTG